MATSALSDLRTEWRRLRAWRLAALSGLALALAAAGVFALVSAAIVDEQRSLAIRLALGATPRALVRRVTLRNGAFVGLGLVGGAAGALVLLRSLAALLYQVSAQDPWTWAMTAITLAAVGLATGYLSARRAASVDLVRALRA